MSRNPNSTTARFRRLLLLALGAVLLAAGPTAIVLAQEERLDGKVRFGNELRIPAGETVAHDLYAFAGTVIVDGTVDGDLVASGGQVQVNGTVTGDVVVAGGQLRIDGTVEQDARLAGGQVTVAGSVGEDLLVASGQVDVTSGGEVGEDMIVSTGQLTVSGTVSGGITGTAGAYDRRGSIGGTDTVAVGGGPAFEERERTTADIVLDALRHWIAVVVFGLLFAWLAPRALAATSAAIRERPLAVVGWGLLGLVGFIVALILITVVMVVVAIALGLLSLAELVAVEITAGLLAMALLSFAFAVVTAFLADAIVGFALASLVAPRDEGRFGGREVALLAAGAAVVVILTSLPVVGGWIKLVVVVLGLGALLAVAWRARPRGRRRERVETAPAPVA